MFLRKGSCHVVGFVLTLAMSWASLWVQAETVSLREVAEGLHVDKDRISVSGISSGAYMAHQFHVIHSSRVMGAALIAGGPYNCAANSYFWSMFDPTGLYTALYICSAINPLGILVVPPNAAFSIQSTRMEAAGGAVDDPANMGNAKIWLFSGGKDKKIPQPVVESVQEYYRAFVAPGNIILVTHEDANHAMITDDFGNACSVDGTPYVNDCDLDAAQEALQHFYGPDPLLPKVDDGELRPVLAFDQTEFFNEIDKSVSMNMRGYIYVPQACKGGAPCALHIAFHGCQQHHDLIDDAFYAGAGYNEVAEANNIVVLYPQTTTWSESIWYQFKENPRGCWDWWGYSGKDYHRRSGKQIQAVAEMINTLVGEELLRATKD